MCLATWHSLFWSVLQLIIDSLPILTPSRVKVPIRSSLSSQFLLFSDHVIFMQQSFVSVIFSSDGARGE